MLVSEPSDNGLEDGAGEAGSPSESPPASDGNIAAPGDAHAEITESGGASEAPRASDETAAPATQPAAPKPYEFAVVLLGILWLATITGRGLAPALPGVRTGLERWIRIVEWTGAVLSQVVIVAGVVVTVRLMLLTLRERSVSILYRLAIVPLVAGCLTIVMTSAKTRLAALVSLSIALVVAALAATSTVPTLRRSSTRAAGLVVGAYAMVALLLGVSRVVALYASSNALAGTFRVAQGLSTVAQLLDFAAITLALWWIRSHVARAGALASAVALTVVALWVTEGDVSVLQVLLGRFFSALAAEPPPLTPNGFATLAEALALTTALVLMVTKTRKPAHRALLGFAILSRGQTDVPLCALAMLLAALMGPLAASSSFGGVLVSLWTGLRLNPDAKDGA